MVHGHGPSVAEAPKGSRSARPGAGASKSSSSGIPRIDYFPFIFPFSGLCCFSCSFFLALGGSGFVSFAHPLAHTASDTARISPLRRTQPPPPGSTTPSACGWDHLLDQDRRPSAVALAGGGLDQSGAQPAQIPEGNSGATGKAWENLDLGRGWGGGRL